MSEQIIETLPSPSTACSFLIYPRTDEIPFDSDRKLMSTAHMLEDGYTMVTKGAVDVLLDRMTHILKDGGIQTFTPEDRKAIEAQNQEFSRGGTESAGVCLQAD